ncbi:MAG TPA: NAD-dependent epimerase/dehydratase family protein [Ignavibacteria bacterium]|jgi:2'-hydroxyisoflavone reductase
MKILILGGTGFVGRILTENLINSGKNPVLFNRGKRNPDIFPELRKIKGDRETADIKHISNESWDVVVDFSGMFPDNVEYIINLLKGKAGRYIFISSVSAYEMDEEENNSEPIKEDFKTYPCTDEQRKDKNIMATYSQKKAECERILLDNSWLDVIIFRPALIYGRYDPTDRFHYWLYRSKSEKEILLPDDGNTRSTSTYSEDFAKILEKSLTIKNHHKVYNAATHETVSLKEIIQTATKLLNTNPQTVNAPAEFFKINNVQPWTDIPLWLGGSHLVFDNSRIKKDFGIQFSSFEDSLKGCIDYYSSLGWPVPKYGLQLDKEKELIKQLRTRKP